MMRAEINQSRSTRRLRAALLASTSLVMATVLASTLSAITPAQALDATWVGSSDGNFNNGANWSSGSVPGILGTATFGTSTNTNLSFSAGNTTIGGWTFNAGASDYNFSNSNLTSLVIFEGAGIVVNGGSATITNGGTFVFDQTSSAGSASIINDAALLFWWSSTAGNATITNTGGLQFSDFSTAGSATITNTGNVVFSASSTAGSATITNSGTVTFDRRATAGNAQLINNDPGAVIDFSQSAGPIVDHKLSAGSIAGNGTFYLGSNELTVGSNNLSTEVTGVIADGGLGGGTGGSLVKTGTGTLTLSGINTYTGGTTVNGGTLAVNGDIAASSGVTVNTGATLGGTGQLPTAVINTGGTLAPGNSIGTITINGNLAFNTGSFYKIEVSPSAADRTNVLGTATLTGATVQAVALPGSFHGQTYTILSATGGFGGTEFAGRRHVCACAQSASDL